MPNRLAESPSLYLRQHADNPVDWHPWGEEAFAEAKRLGKPVLVSVGYSACHWCHVMAHESFENPTIARLMNQHFVCIKVDREEHPDVDQIYMEAVQMITQRGGWPLNAFCLPDGRPFFGGTYFPPEDRGQGIVPWPQLIMRISDYYQKNRDELEENADNILKNMTEGNKPIGATGEDLGGQHLITAAEGICTQHDDEWGGFGEAPKFPPSMTLDFLLAVRGSAACEAKPELAQRIDKVARMTLKGMAHGGLFDQVGGGFSRYSVDKLWLIPHFEKMLYDNGLLLDVYAKGWQRYGDPMFRAVAEETYAWLEREMRAPEGAWRAALDADSEGEEGKYYVWKPEEIKAILGEEDGATFCDAYNITEKGNFEHGTTNPAFVYDSFEKRQSLEALRCKVLAARQERIAPGLDEKVLLSWNSLVVRGLTTAGFTFGEKTWIERAREVADWLWETFASEDADGYTRLKAVYYSGEGARYDGRLDDYAWFAEALLTLCGKVDWIEPGASQLYLDRAIALVNTIQERFADPNMPGCFFTADDQTDLVTRKKTWFDNATPAGNSAMVQVYAALYALTGAGDYEAQLQALRPAYTGIAQRAPSAAAHALSGFTHSAVGIPVVKIKGAQDLDALRAAISARPWRPVFLQTTDDAAQPDGFQLCVGTQCLAPTTDAATLAENL
ncbi:thioredoxin domain-containing protein [Cerasicoccus frondis]|uniref:thioredoxin domain-containing protein n=1 Tax=Cerasicoccus frondis TaxID=490090 RepID=UPI00285251BA|nr:thioredoxin domain-containing protein [Cerasicoccus frondis]